MSRSGDEMILELVGLLKTAAKDEDKKDPKDEKKDDKPEDKEKDEKKDKKDDDKKKKASVLAGVLSDLVKMANTLDEAGAEEASNLIDEALQVVLNSVKKAELGEENMGLDEVFEGDPAPVDVGVPSEEDMPEMGSSGDDPKDTFNVSSEIAKLLIDKGWEPPPGYEV